MLHVVAFRLMLRQVGHVTETTPLRLLFLFCRIVYSFNLVHSLFVFFLLKYVRLTHWPRALLII